MSHRLEIGRGSCRGNDWSSDVCSSDLGPRGTWRPRGALRRFTCRSKAPSPLFPHRDRRGCLTAWRSEEGRVGEMTGVQTCALPISDPAALGGRGEPYDASPAGVKHQAPFSRIGIGADVSPLGIGIKSAIVLNDYFDARLMGNFFNYNSARFEIEGFNVNANLHMASAAAALDWYPFNSIWRLSPGVIFFNSNQISTTANIIPEIGRAHV